MDDFDRGTALRNEAEEANLSLTWAFKNGKTQQELATYFFFDLNQGQIEMANVTPERVMELVKLARKHASHAGYGEHIALLNLVARRAELATGKDRIYWSRPYHVGAYDRPDVWIPLAEWLKENGQDPESVKTETAEEN